MCRRWIRTAGQEPGGRTNASFIGVDATDRVVLKCSHRLHRLHRFERAARRGRPRQRHRVRSQSPMAAFCAGLRPRLAAVWFAVGETMLLESMNSAHNRWPFDLARRMADDRRRIASRSAEARRHGGRCVHHSAHARLAATPSRRARAGGGSAATAPRREPIENLTAAEADLLEAICARIIPSDANGPGAREARAAHYIDRALGGALAESREAYRAGLRGVRSLLPIVTRRAVHGIVGARSGLGADRRRNRRGHRLPGILGAVLRHGAHAHAARHVRRSVLRRQRQLRRLGSDRLSRRAPQRLGRRSAARREADADAPIGVRPRDVHQGVASKEPSPAEAGRHGGA